MPQHRSSKGPSQRQLRVGELIRHKLSEMLSRGEIHDDILSTNVITVPEVRMTPDLRIATAYVMPLGGGNIDEIISALSGNKKFIRSEIARAVALKYAPDVRFRPDESFDEALRIEALLNSPKVRQDIERD
ncbi:MAG: 30S ribosome-binding factor RbfA [Hyphomicrobiaceae bacterium]